MTNSDEAVPNSVAIMLLAPLFAVADVVDAEVVVLEGEASTPP